MKLFFALVATGAIFAASCSPKSGSEAGNTANASLKGQLKNSVGDTLYLVDYNSGTAIGLDTTVTDETGNFVFDAPVKEPGFYNLEVGSKAFAMIILEPNKPASLSGDAKNLTSTCVVEGSDDNKYLKEFNDFATTYNKQKVEIMSRLKQMQADFQVQVNLLKDQKRIDSVSKTIEGEFNLGQQQVMKLDDDAQAFIKKFVSAHPSSLANLPALYLASDPQSRQQLLDPYDNFSYFDTTAKALAARYPTMSSLKPLQDQLASIRTLAAGAIAPEIVLNDPNGKSIPLSSLRGKVVLIDFWASWCGPCRLEMPNVVAAYKKYKSKGFDVYSVSLDKDKTQWTDAIKKDGLVWPNHVSDLGYWQSAVVPLYKIQGIPLTFLIDKEGRIVARGLRGIALDEKLAELFASK